jgi:hypothetical protein
MCAVAHCGSGCLPAQEPTPLEQAYVQEIVACAATSLTVAEDEACRAAVNRKYGL